MSLQEMVAVCGLDCHECGAFLATQENDDQKRAEVAQEWSKLFKVEIRAEDINCEGCLSDGGRIFNYCKVCEIRKCGKEKGLKNCGYCSEYPCHKLDFILSNASDAKKRLDEINSTFKSLRVVFPAACGEFVIPAEAGIQKTGLDSASCAE